ncbi:hypothetical protein M8C21_013662 [Ambrosia artemisiifolia]|uniref:AAA+ ATPase domain-containing protein n=1 Tax=Ambrosia artemisiifolia TaxID=4212 RepID=A0AAD5DAG0_AMBAR|nr:hypothetical protein M8C21_013662 [Ambrosia artemisiifolia]
MAVMSNIFSPAINPPRSRIKNITFSTPSPSSLTLSLPHPHNHLVILAKEKSLCPSSLKLRCQCSKEDNVAVSTTNVVFFLLQQALPLLFQIYQHTKMSKIKPRKEQSVTFDDVEGVDSAKEELLDIVMCINKHEKYMKLGAKLPRGVLLVGPPGVGKTLLARAVAGETEVPFFPVPTSQLVIHDVNIIDAVRVRDLFQAARKHSPSIIFIDEIVVIGHQTLRQLLAEMDGFDKDRSVLVIAATNRPNLLDHALMGRSWFFRKILVGKPDEDGRRKIFSLYLRDVPMEEDKETVSRLVASRTPGLVGADLKHIANMSVLLSIRRGGRVVTSDDVLQAVESNMKNDL